MHKKCWYKSGLIWLLVSILIIVLDQWTKHLAITYLRIDYPRPVLPFLNWTLMFNSGAAFSFLNQFGYLATLLFSGISIAISIAIVLWLYRLSARHIYLCLALAFILGGAISNLFDRLTLGLVIDFIDLYIHTWHWPIFNIADSMICIGTVLLLLWFYTPILKKIFLLNQQVRAKDRKIT